MRYTKSILQFSLSWDVWPFIECAGLPHSAPSFLPHQHMSRAAHLPMMYSTHNDGLVYQGSRQHLAVADHHKATTYNLPGQYKQAYPPSHTVQGYKQAPASIWHNMSHRKISPSFEEVSFPIILKFGRHLDSTDAKEAFKFQSDMNI